MKNGYDLSRKWFDWCFENPEKISPNHSALYFFCIEHCNRLGWKDKFGLPTTMAKEAIGIRSYNTYIKTLNELVEWGFILMIEKSKNQYSSNIIALSKFNKALDKALDKAFIKHDTKQSESTRQSIDSIDKQENNEQINKEQVSAPTLANIFLERNGKFISELETELLSSEIAKSNRMMLHGISKEKHDDFAKKFIAKIKSDEWWNGRSDAIRYFGNMIKTWLREEKSGRKGSTAEPFKKKTFDLSSPS